MARMAAAAVAAVTLCCAAYCAAWLPASAATATNAAGPLPQLLPAWLPLPPGLTSSNWVSNWTALAHTLPAVAASLPGWVVALAAAAAVLAVAAVAMQAAPTRLRLVLLRIYMHRMVRKSFPDMWDMYGSWARPAEGREYWVAELLPGSRVVGGVALKAGAAARPLPPLQPSGAANVTDSGADGPVGASLAGGNGKGAAAAAHMSAGATPPGEEPPEDAAGFTEFDVQGHGPLETGDALVYRMVADKAVRRRGVGRRLMEVVMARAAGAGVARVLLATANADAAAFYRACGFETRPGAVGYGGGGNVLWRSVGGGARERGREDVGSGEGAGERRECQVGVPGAR